MVTKKPILLNGHIFILGRLHSHVINLETMETRLFRDYGENFALKEAKKARIMYEALED